MKVIALILAAILLASSFAFAGVLWIKSSLHRSTFLGTHFGTCRNLPFVHKRVFGTASLHRAPVRAIRDGIVGRVEMRYADAGCDDPALIRGGNEIIVVDPVGVEVVYGHLQKGSALVKEGDRVRAGQLIAGVGNSGKSVLPHLHIHAGGVTLDGYHTVALRFEGCDGSTGAVAPGLGKRHCGETDGGA